MGPLGRGRQPNQKQTDSNWQGLFSQALEFLSWSPGPLELSQKELIVVDVNPNPHPTPSPFLRRIVAMAPLTTAARALARSAAPRTAVRCMSATAVRPSDSTYESPFRGSQNTTKVPDFSHYAAKNGANKNLMYQYFMVGALGTITAAGAKSTIQGEPRRATPGSRERCMVAAEGSIGQKSPPGHKRHELVASLMRYVF